MAKKRNASTKAAKPKSSKAPRKSAVKGGRVPSAATAKRKAKRDKSSSRRAAKYHSTVSQMQSGTITKKEGNKILNSLQKGAGDTTLSWMKKERQTGKRAKAKKKKAQGKKPSKKAAKKAPVKKAGRGSAKGAPKKKAARKK